ncbi:MAG: hypothetical protein ACRDT8_10325, partial [Micromonosporaceae bacterium]
SSHDAEADDSAIEADRKSNSLDSQQDRSVAESALEPDEGAIAEPQAEKPEPEEPQAERAAGSARGDRFKRKADSDSVKSRSKPAAARKVTAPRSRPGRRAREAEAAVRRLRRTAMAIGMWTLVFALLAGAGWYFTDNQEEPFEARGTATAAAAAAARAIFSYDYRSFDQSVANGKEFVTGKFAKEYAKTTGALKATAQKEKAVVRAEVKSTGVMVEEATADRIPVLLYVNQYRRNVNIKGEKLDQNRVVLTMVRVSDDQTGQDDWLVANAVAV